MTVKELFKQVETANEFKKLIGEGTIYRISIVDNEPIPTTIATVDTYKEYKKEIHNYYIPEVEKALINAEIVKTITNREFKVKCEDLDIMLYVE